MSVEMNQDMSTADLLRVLAEKNKYIEELEHEHATLVDERNIMEKDMNMLLYAKVSQIIQLEKDKAKLQSEIEAIKYVTDKTKKNMYEKDIHGLTYYISKTIHEKKDDGSIGDKVGVLRKIEGNKYHVEWF